MISAEHISDIKEEMSTMQDLFNLQEMFSLKEKEKELENQLKKLGYIG
jgi:hypothetical protein